MAVIGHFFIQNDLPFVDENGNCLCICEDGMQFTINIASIDLERCTILKCEIEDKLVEVEVPEIFRDFFKSVISKTENVETTEASCSRENGPFQWTDASTKLFLSLYKDKKNLVSQRNLKTFKQMWKVISEEMASHNYIISPTQAENKMKTMDRAYKNMIRNNKKTGRGRATCNFEDDLNDILGKKHNIVPLVISSSSGLSLRNSDNEKSATPTSICLPLMIPEPAEEGSHEKEGQKEKSKKKTLKTGRNDEILETVLQEIRKNRKSREEFQERMFNEYKKFVDNTLEHRENRRKIAEKKLEILEDLKKILTEKSVI